jgi:ferredoxin-nitrate reductase
MGWDGVFSLRTRWDADRIKTYLDSGARVLIMGGGLLGLEMAASLDRAGFRVAIIEMADRLMQRQLDETAATLLQQELEDRGIEVYSGDVVMDYLGHGRIRGVLTKADRHLACDALIVAVGTRPNIGLAVRARLHHSRGVTVNDHLQTSDRNIYAAGEIAEHRSELYGITPAAEEQAAIAAAHLAGDGWAAYAGSVPFNILKIDGLVVCALGTSVIPEDESDSCEEIVFLDRRRRVYKKCVVRRDRLIGAILVGDSAEFDTFRQLIDTGIELEEQRATLLGSSASDRGEPPIGRLVCSCKYVGEGNLKREIAAGCTNLPALCSRSRAGTGCGSCRPEVQMILERELEGLSPVGQGDGSAETVALA